jgi:ketosteroid isomerase-like protein
VAWSDGDLVKQLVEGVNRGDAEAVLACYGDDAVLKFHDINPAAVAPVAVGKDAVRAWVYDWFGAFGNDNQWEVHELLDLGFGQVFLDGTMHVRGNTAGVPVSARVGVLFVIRGGEIVRADQYPSPEAAKAATGIPGE